MLVFMDMPKLDFLDIETNSQIPIPSLEHLRKLTKTDNKDVTKVDGELQKYKREYEHFCQWSAMPDEIKKPKTLVAFEKRWGLPKNYTSYFKQRADYKDKRLTYFWDWMIENLPNVVYMQYKKATTRNDTNSAKFFAELLSSHINIEKPAQVVQPFVLVGVTQDKIDQLFTPGNYNEIEDVIPTK